jgi:hypothetical protein
MNARQHLGRGLIELRQHRDDVPIAGLAEPSIAAYPLPPAQWAQRKPSRLFNRARDSRQWSSSANRPRNSASLLGNADTSIPHLGRLCSSYVLVALTRQTQVIRTHLLVVETRLVRLAYFQDEVLTGRPFSGQRGGSSSPGIAPRR